MRGRAEGKRWEGRYSGREKSRGRAFSGKL
jgi:hypothetical protein